MKRAGMLLAAALMIISACSCGAAVTEASRETFAMDTLVSVKTYGSSCAEAANAAAERIAELERLFSVTDKNSDIARLNSRMTGEVSDETAYVISEALGQCEKTGGALDITIYPVVRLWGFTTEEYRVPADDEIASALGRTGYENVKVSGNRVTFPDGYMIDLGSCAKGYAGDKLKETIASYGVNSAIINLGGNVTALGNRPDGSGWTVGIADPFSPSELLGKVRVSDKSVVTSGGYQRYFVGDDGKKYIHIIDPAAGRPAESGLASVTVIGDSGLMCDALSTALFVMGEEKAVEYRNKHGGFEMILVTDDGRIVVTAGIADAFENTSGLPSETIYER